jgi:hypothetical protein
MPSLLTEVTSVLGMDIGSVQTKGFLFDVVEDSYHFIASGSAFSTHTEPFFDIGVGIYEAISHLQEITGRNLLDSDGNLIIPSQVGGGGVDRLVVTTTCGADLQTATFGLLTEVSLDSANRLAKTSYTNIVEGFGINDRRPVHGQIDALLAARPELLIVAGGTDYGASRSLVRMVQMISTALQIMPREERPEVLFCGNRVMVKKVNEMIEKVCPITVTENIRPTIDSEDLDRAMSSLGTMVMENRMRTINGLSRIAPICSDPPMLANLGFHRIIRFLGKQYDPAKGVLGIDLGSSHTVASYANLKTHSLSVIPIGVGDGLEKVLQKSSLEEITQWLPMVIPSDEVRSILWQKTLFPGLIPMTESSLAVELAAARLILRMTMKELALRGDIPSRSFEPIIVSGSILMHTATPQQVLLTLLDGIQPIGITPLVLDKHGITSLLGAMVKVNPILPIQILETTAYVNLATVITAVSGAQSGSTILRVRLQYSSGNYIDAEVKQGSITALPLNSGENGQLFIKMIRRTQIEDLEISDDPIKVKGGVCGVVIDARGRPLELPRDDRIRQEQFKNWAFMLGG